jgi:type II secretory pathway pseudopilin PulG
MRISRAGRLSNSRGFTLVELGMVVLLLGLFATLSIPLFYSTSDSALHTDARKISTAVRHLYNEAAITGAQHRIRCMLETGRFEFQFVDGAGEWRGIENKRNALELDHDVRIRDIWSEDVGEISNGTATINIYPQGWMPATTIHLQSGSGSKTRDLSIHLLPLSGLAEIEEGYHAFEG